MRTINIKNLKVGDKLPDSPASKYGQYVDFEVEEIRVTKGGRFVILIGRTYINPDGLKVKRQSGARYSNGALSGNTTMTIL